MQVIEFNLGNIKISRNPIQGPSHSPIIMEAQICQLNKNIYQENYPLLFYILFDELLSVCQS